MSAGILQWLNNLRCPACNALQPPFALLTTFGSFGNIKLYDAVPCVACDARLRVEPALPKPRHYLVAIGYNLTRAAAILVPFALLAPRMITLWGGWAFLALPLLVGLWGLLINLLIFLPLRRYLRKVTVV